MHQRNLCYHKQKEKERGGKKFNEMSKHEIEPEEKTADWRTQDHKMTKKSHIDLFKSFGIQRLSFVFE